MSYIYNSMKPVDLFLEIASNPVLLNILDQDMIMEKLSKHYISHLFLEHPAEIFNSKLFPKVSMNCIYRFMAEDLSRFSIIESTLWKWRYWDWFAVFKIILNTKDYNKMEQFKLIYTPFRIRLKTRETSVMNAVLYPDETDSWYRLSSGNLYDIIVYKPELIETIRNKPCYWQIGRYHWEKLQLIVDEKYINKKYLQE